MVMDDKEISEKVRMCTAQALGLDVEEVVPDAILFDDLGAESLDLLDIVFRLEKTFGIQIPRGGIQSSVLASEDVKEEDLVKDGILTPLGIERLRKEMPEINPDRIPEGFRAEDAATLFTVQTFVNLTKRHLAAKEGKGT
jgi:acyl carrier protein